MGRTPCCSHEELKKGAWTVEEDQKLIAYIQKNGTGSWRALPQKAGLQRCGKSCRLRWFNYLRPDIKRGQLTEEEEKTIIRLHAVLGNRWSSIAKHLPRRTDNEIKNYWNSYLKRHLEKKGVVDPVGPKPISTTTSSSSDSEAITTTELNSNQVSQLSSAKQSQHSSSKTVSSSTQLLNKVARKIVASGYLVAVKSWQPGIVDGNSSIIDHVTEKSGNGFNSTVSNLSSMSSNSSNSVQLLNKMAKKVHSLEAAKAVLSKSMKGDDEKGEPASDCSGNGSDQFRDCLDDALNLFEDEQEITRIMGSPDRMLYSEMVTPSCFSDNNEDNNRQCVSSNYVCFGGCAANVGGSGDCSVSELNLLNSGNYCVESPNSTSCFIENAPVAASVDDFIEILTCEDLEF